MYTVCYFDEATFDTAIAFTGSLSDCIAYAAGDEELYIVEPDGFTVYA